MLLIISLYLMIHFNKRTELQKLRVRLGACKNEPLVLYIADLFKAMLLLRILMFYVLVLSFSRVLLMYFFIYLIYLSK